jgi:hypothetical protein
MSGEAWLYLVAVLINAVNLFLQVFFTIMYSDLEWCVNPPPLGPLSAPSPAHALAGTSYVPRARDMLTFVPLQ